MLEDSKDMKEYIEKNEELLTQYRMRVHENKNQLLLIKEMLHDDTEFLEEYLNLLIEKNETMEKSEWISILSPIPISGIKNFLNIKLTKLQQTGATIELIVSDELKKIKIKKMKAEEFDELCTILGVLMDNIIDAVTEEKEKLVSIYIYLENNKIHAEFANYSCKNIDIDRINENGYTSKGLGRGTGLYLLKKIINKKDIYSLKTRVYANFFVQHISMKLRNT